MKSMPLETNVIHVGDNITNLKNIPDESVDMCVTSPPYYNLRDYKNSGQIGAEKTVNQFVESLCKVFDEIHRILKLSLIHISEPTRPY